MLPFWAARFFAVRDNIPTVLRVTFPDAEWPSTAPTFLFLGDRPAVRSPNDSERSGLERHEGLVQTPELQAVARNKREYPPSMAVAAHFHSCYGVGLPGTTVSAAGCALPSGLQAAENADGTRRAGLLLAGASHPHGARKHVWLMRMPGSRAAAAQPREQMVRPCLKFCPLASGFQFSHRER